MRVYLCISENRDSDLFELYSDIGATNFRKITKLCISGIFDEKVANRARTLALSGLNCGGAHEKYLGGVKLRINISDKEYAAQSVLSSIKPGLCSNFLKTCIRQVLGPQIMLKYFLKNPEEISSTTIAFIPSSFSFAVKQPTVATQVRKRRQSGSAQSHSIIDKPIHLSETSVASQVESMPNIAQNTPISIPEAQKIQETYSVPVTQMPIATDTTDDEEDDGFDMLSALEAML